MEALTRLVADSLARHGLDRPVDPRRLQWSRWFRCDSTHSLLVVPSKPGIFALAEEITASVARAPSFATAAADAPRAHGETGGSIHSASVDDRNESNGSALSGGAALEPCDSSPLKNAALAAEFSKRMLAVLQFSEDDDMAFTLDRMFTRINPMRSRLASGRCFLRFVVIEDADQRRTICAALNQWMVNSATKASGLPPDFSSSLELNLAEAATGTDRVGPTLLSDTAAPVTDRVGRTLLSDSADAIPKPVQAPQPTRTPDILPIATLLDSGANKNLHCPQPLPSGF